MQRDSHANEGVRVRVRLAGIREGSFSSGSRPRIRIQEVLRASAGEQPAAEAKEFMAASSDKAGGRRENDLLLYERMMAIEDPDRETPIRLRQS